MDPVYVTSAARTPEDREIVYRIRRTAYINSDADIDDAPLKDAYDERENSLSHLLYRDLDPIGTIRASMCSSEFGWAPLPAMEHYRTELELEFGNRIAIAQSSYFAIAPLGRMRSRFPKAMLFQALANTVARHGIEWIITIVRNRPTQLSFYSKLGFQRIAVPRIHPQVNRMGVLLRTTTQNFADWANQQLK